MSQTFEVERITRLNSEIDLLHREITELKRTNTVLKLENRDALPVHAGGGNAEIGLSLIYMEKLKDAIHILDTLNSSLERARTASDSIRGDLNLDTKLERICRENAGDLKNMLLDFSKNLPGELVVENQEMVKTVDKRVEQLQNDLYGILNKILILLGRKDANAALERTVLEKLNKRLQ